MFEITYKSCWRLAHSEKMHIYVPRRPALFPSMVRLFYPTSALLNHLVNVTERNDVHGVHRRACSSYIPVTFSGMCGLVNNCFPPGLLAHCSANRGISVSTILELM